MNIPPPEIPFLEHPLVWILLIGAAINALLVVSILTTYMVKFPWRDTEAGPYLIMAFVLLLIRHIITMAASTTIEPHQLWYVYVTVLWNIVAGVGEIKLLTWLTGKTD